MKKIISLLLFAVLVMSFSACSEDTAQNSSAKDDSSGQIQSDTSVSSKQEVSSSPIDTDSSNEGTVNGNIQEENESENEPETNEEEQPDVTEEENEIKSDAVTGLTASGTIDTSPKLTYTATVELQNRTETSVEMRIRWTTTVGAKSFTYYGQRFKASAQNVDFGTVIVSEYGELSTPDDIKQEATVFSDWNTVELDTAEETAVDMIVYYYQTGPSGNDTTIKQQTSGLDLTWKVTVPAA